MSYLSITQSVHPSIGSVYVFSKMGMGVAVEMAVEMPFGVVVPINQPFGVVGRVDQSNHV